MPRTSKTYTTFAKLNLGDEDAVLIVKLMMAFNDLSLSNEGLSIFKPQFLAKPTDKNRGAVMYFMRLQASHLYEALKIVEQIATNVRLRNLAERGSESSKAAFSRLLTLLKNGPEKKKFKQFVGQLRDSLTFHYEESGKRIKRAIERLATNPLRNTTSITRSTETYSWRMTAADEIIDTIVCRQIWKIPDDVDLMEEANKFADYGFNVFCDFTDFSSDLIFRYIEEGA